MANIIRQVLNVQGMRLPLFTGGMSRLGIGITGTFVGTLTFRGSNDGLNFFPTQVFPFPLVAPLTGQQTTTTIGNFEISVNNLIAYDVVFTTRTSGSATVVLAASVDDSYQDAFLAASSQFVSQSVSGGLVNALTIAAQANRAWRCRTLVVGFSTAPANAVDIKIADGGSTTLWETYVPKDTPVGFYNVPLPADSNTPGVSGGGVVGTPGNSMVITLAAPGGSVVSTVNAEIIPA